MKLAICKLAICTRSITWWLNNDHLNIGSFVSTTPFNVNISVHYLGFYKWWSWTYHTKIKTPNPYYKIQKIKTWFDLSSPFCFFEKSYSKGKESLIEGYQILLLRLNTWTCCGCPCLALEIPGWSNPQFASWLPLHWAGAERDSYK